jgi:predicted PurR-regulated permease PerM
MSVSIPPPTAPPAPPQSLIGTAFKTVDPRRDLALTVRWTVILGAVLLAVWAISDIVLLIFFAVLIGAMLRGLADMLTRVTRLPTWLTLTVVTVGIVGLMAALAWRAGPLFVNEGAQLWHEVSRKLSGVQGRFGGLFGGTAVATANGGAGARSGGAGVPAVHELTMLAPKVASSTLGFIGGLLVLLVTALYFAIAPVYYREGVVLLFPIRYRDRARHVLTDIGHTLQWWLLGQAVDMIIVGVLSGLGLYLLGVKLALALGVIAGLFTFVPYFGPIVSAVPALLVAGTMGWTTVAWVVVIYLACHGVEGYVVAPFVQKRTVELPPALTVLSMTILATLFGLFGLIVATPVVAALMVIIREIYVGDVLGDREHATPHIGLSGRD